MIAEKKLVKKHCFNILYIELNLIIMFQVHVHIFLYLKHDLSIIVSYFDYTQRKDRYLRGLKKINWTEEAKKKMETALQKYDIVSSDDSECEDDEVPSRNVVYKIRKLKFLSTKAQKMKRELYNCYVGSLPKPLQANFKQRKHVDGLFSDRTAPENCPSWLLKTTDE